jgi:hypothetical protein
MGATTPMLTPTMPASTRVRKLRAALPLRVKMLAALPKVERLTIVRAPSRSRAHITDYREQRAEDLFFCDG